MAYVANDSQVDQRTMWYHLLWEAAQQVNQLDPMARIAYVALMRLIASTAGLSDGSIENWRRSTWGRPAPSTIPLQRGGTR